MIRFVIAICFLFSLQKDTPVLSWSESYKLTWSDFKGKPNKYVKAAAITASGISFGYSIKQSNGNVVDFTTEVFAHFYPEESWYKPGVADHHILGHEQLHYDITELYARRFRKSIDSLKPEKDIKKVLNKLHKKTIKDLDAMQNLYDAETNYSIDYNEQLRWSLYISKKLEELSEFKSVDSQP